MGSRVSSGYAYHVIDFVYGARRNALMPLFGEGLFTQDGQAWKHSREMVRKQFARIQYTNLEVFADHVELLVDRLKKREASVVDLHPLFCNFTLDTTTSLLFGESAGSLHKDVEDELGETLNEASWWSAIRVQLAYLYWLCAPPKYFKLCDKVRAYADHWVTKALGTWSSDLDREGTRQLTEVLPTDDQRGEDMKEERYVFIRSLFDELKDRKLVRDQLVNVLLAGRDTTAGLLSWTL